MIVGWQRSTPTSPGVPSLICHCGAEWTAVLLLPLAPDPYRQSDICLQCRSALSPDPERLAAAQAAVRLADHGGTTVGADADLLAEVAAILGVAEVSRGTAA